MAGKPIKTKPTAVSVEAYIDAVTPDVRRQDARTLVALMSRLSGEAPRMWGPSIVGFGERTYRTDAGREGRMLKIGFSPRKPATVLYISAGIDGDPLIARLGKVTTGKSCIYVKRLVDVDMVVLEAMVERALARADALTAL